MDDSVAVDAKRILLRYGAPISTLDKISEVERIEFARMISKTALPERGMRLQEVLFERGYIDKITPQKKPRAKARAKPRAD